jgi:hypothetical protein
MSKTSGTTQFRILAGAAVIAATVGTGLVLVAQTAKAATTYQVKLTCPIDGQPFTATLISSYFQSGMRLDFKPIGAVVTPHPYPVCPGNGFVMYQDSFSDYELNAIRAIVLAAEYRLLRAENTDHFMVAYVKQRLGANQYELGHTYLRASWEAERDAPTLVDRYRMLARQAFDTSMYGKRGNTEEWWTAAVLAAELDRLLGHFKAVELRISALPLAEMGATYPGLRTVLDQIRMHALQHNSGPEQMQPPAHIGGTVGRAPINAVN